ncbi:MAG: NAD(P)/FAD-dependent oxidoreductase, partial [Anaerolineae bacterium]
QRLGAMADADVARLRQQVRDLRVPVTGTRPLSQSQLSTGGVPLAEVDGRTMASRLVPGLHLAGEVLNVMGPCGGYNLHWAMASGAIAGSAAATLR